MSNRSLVLFTSVMIVAHAATWWTLPQAHLSDAALSHFSGRDNMTSEDTSLLRACTDQTKHTITIKYYECDPASTGACWQCDAPAAIVHLFDASVDNGVMATNMPARFCRTYYIREGKCVNGVCDFPLAVTKGRCSGDFNERNPGQEQVEPPGGEG